MARGDHGAFVAAAERGVAKLAKLAKKRRGGDSCPAHAVRARGAPARVRHRAPTFRRAVDLVVTTDAHERGRAHRDAIEHVAQVVTDDREKVVSRGDRGVRLLPLGAQVLIRLLSLLDE